MVAFLVHIEMWKHGKTSNGMCLRKVNLISGYIGKAEK